PFCRTASMHCSRRNRGHHRRLRESLRERGRPYLRFSSLVLPLSAEAPNRRAPTVDTVVSTCCHLNLHGKTERFSVPPFRPFHSFDQTIILLLPARRQMRRSLLQPCSTLLRIRSRKARHLLRLKG